MQRILETSGKSVLRKTAAIRRAIEANDGAFDFGGRFAVVVPMARGDKFFDFGDKHSAENIGIDIAQIASHPNIEKVG